MPEPNYPPAGAMPARRASRPPGPRNLLPLSSAFALQRDPIRFALEIWHRYGDVVRFRFLFWPAYVFLSSRSCEVGAPGESSQLQ